MQQRVLALQRSAGNAATARILQRKCACEEPTCKGNCVACACGGSVASGGACASCQAREVGELTAARSVASRTMSQRMLQRDGAARQQISNAIKTNSAAAAPGAGAGSKSGGADPGYEEAFRILNGLAMYDMLSTLTALQRSGDFDPLNAHFASAIGVYVARLRLAFDAVAAKGSMQADAFALAHRDVMVALPADQRQDVVRYLDPSWFDALKATDDAEPLIAAIRATPAYGALAPDDRTVAEEIITEGKKNLPKVVYYMTKLKLLFDTPLKPPAQTGAETAAATDTAVKAEQQRVAKPAGAKNTGLEEKASRAPKRTWTAIPGKFGGGTYYVDKTDVTNIVVRASIHLKPTGTANSLKGAAAIKKMEDGIEKAASTEGYVVDLTFLKTPAADTFVVQVDPDRWEDAENWSGGDPTGFAHELHHMFTFEVDKYNYIEAHAANDSMEIPNRLHWFRLELTKPDGFNDPTSIMDSAGHPNDVDVCQVIGADVPTCVAARQKKRATHP